ncbi:hypothetical protein [Mycolicibacterium sp. D5.8-2]|uniref:hypothetical protein n=1 Tax=Mycolicibacterium sp. D5.8-2 TaxID=3085903 RepID=UPI00298C16A4|nr:hypothetical protein [Mycolicibacterium sp. D5.8-2]
MGDLTAPPTGHRYTAESHGGARFPVLATRHADTRGRYPQDSSGKSVVSPVSNVNAATASRFNSDRERRYQGRFAATDEPPPF